MTIILIIALIFYVIGAAVELIWQRNVEKQIDEILWELSMLKARIGRKER